MTKLVLAAESFPYGQGEISFILPELRRLKKYFNVVILSHADDAQYQGGMCAELPDGVELFRLGRPCLTVTDKLKAFVLYFFDPDGRSELREILGGKKDRIKRLYQSFSFYAQMRSDRGRLRQTGFFHTDEPVIYYSYWYTYYCYSALKLARQAPNLRVLTRTHGVDLYHERIPGDRQPFRHQMETGLDAIIFACHYARRYYEERIRQDIDRSRLYMCRVGTENVRLHKEWGERDTWELVSCSSAVPLKRISLIIDGLALTDGRKIHWTHIGDGSDLIRLREYAGERLGHKENISYTFSGYVENDKVTRYYAEHPVDCFITTSSTEGGSPVSVQEAMAQGIPVIGTDVGGITEMIQGNGILLPRDPDGSEVAAAIGRMMSLDEHEKTAMQKQSRRLWEQEFCIDVSYQELLEALTHQSQEDYNGTETSTDADCDSDQL